jgi:ABC-type uncharacterized transport system auxiliary subunit
MMKIQARADLPLGSALRLVIVLAQAEHPQFAAARARWIERAEEEGHEWQLIVIAVAALEGLRTPRVAVKCERVLMEVSQNWEWRPAGR